MNESYIELSEDEFKQELSKADEYKRFIDFDSSDKNMIKSHLTKYKSYFSIMPSSNRVFSCFKNYNISEVIYCKIGITTTKQFSIVKLDDEWYLIEIQTYSRDKGPSTQFYKCDQIDGILDLLQGKTKKHKVFNKEEFDKKRVYNSKVNSVIKRIKSMNWKEFEKLYNQLMK